CLARLQHLGGDHDSSNCHRGKNVSAHGILRESWVEQPWRRDGKVEKKLVLWFTNDERRLPLIKTSQTYLKFQDWPI
ncbi:MAG: hypothetical protein WBZ08_11430, partial [Pseudolabrys sp.]